MTKPPKPEPVGAIIALISYSPEAPDGTRIKVGLSKLCMEMLSLLSDLELKVFATEVGLVVTKRFEMPPSPETIPKT